jgi:hypothetical protein
MKSFFTILFVAILTSLNAQSTFHKYYGGTQEEYAYAFQETNDGGFIVCGRTFSFGTGGWEGYVLRLNGNGDTLWTKTYGNVQYDEIQDIETTSDGGFIMIGHTWTTDAAGDVYVMKLDASGNISWDQTYGGTAGLSDKGYSIRQTTDGGYVMTGTTASFGSGGDDVYVVKINNTGAITWTRTIGTAGVQEAGREIQQTSDGGYVVAGYTDGSGTSFLDVLLVKLNNSGVVQWSKTIGGSSYDFAYTVEETSDNGFIVGATTNSFGAGNWDAYLIKTNSSGVVQWSKTYGLSGEDRVQAAKQTNDGGYILCGRSNGFGAGNLDATLLKTDASGNLQWAKAYGGSLEDQAWYVREYSGGGFVICGYGFSFGAGSREAFLIKTNTSGSAGCNETSGTLTTTSPSTVSGNLGTSSSGGTAYAVPTAIRGTASVVTTRCFSSGCAVVAGFNASQTSVCVGGTLGFTNTSTGATTYQWFLDSSPVATTSNHSQVFNVPGPHQIKLIASAGPCSDTVTQTILVNTATTATDQHTACNSYTWINGITYTQSTNSPTYTLVNAAGCDSIVTLNLTILQSSASTDQQTACDFLTWIDGNTYTQSTNSPTYTLINAAGCDSIVTLNLTVFQSDAVTELQTACDAFTWIDGNTYTQSTNTPTYTLTNAAGCDSVITLNLTVQTSTDTSFSVSSSGPFVAPSGAIYTSSGTYQDTIPNQAGCDSIMTIQFTLNPTGTDLFSTLGLSIYPNPVVDMLQIVKPVSWNAPTSMHIVNANGQIVYSSSQPWSSHDLRRLAAGMYHLRLFSEEGSINLNIMKR